MKRAAKKAATRTALVDAAVDEFAAFGYRGARIERIAERAGVTTGALYTHFPSKDAMFVAVYEVATTRRAEEVARIAGLGPTAAPGEDGPVGRLAPIDAGDRAPGLAGAVDAWLAGHLADPRWFRLGVDFLIAQSDLPELPVGVAQARRELREHVSRWLANLAEAGGRRLLVPADELALQLLALANGTVIEHLGDPSTFVEGRFGRCVERLFLASSEEKVSAEAGLRPRAGPPPAPARPTAPT